MSITYQTQLYSNNATSTLVGMIGPTDTSIPIVDSSRFSIPTPGSFYLVTIDDGYNYEVIGVYGKSANTLTGCIRGLEGTTPRSFPTGTKIEQRVTSGTLSNFLRRSDLLTPITGLSDLTKPSSTNNASYVLSQLDDGGSPIVAFASSGKWRFVNFPTVLLSGSADATSSTTAVTYTGVNISAKYSANSMILQFTSGANQGQCRMVTAAGAGTISWTQPLPVSPGPGDTFEVYRSLNARLAAIETALSL
ncbi:MAG TPA: hypothetical protein VFM18_01935 [Methanosarcina sp.]|nr:hypothetical protein [Methanosarcina sp.]